MLWVCWKERQGECGGDGGVGRRVMDAAVGRSTGMLRISMVLALAAALGGCGDGAPQAPRGEADPPAAASAGSPASAVAITDADARLSVTTHRGMDGVSGLRIRGTCSGGTVRVEVGHAAPYKPLRKVGNPQIDSITAAKRAVLTARCATGRFEIRRRQLNLRLGRGPLRATPSGGDAVDIRIKGFGIE